MDSERNKFTELIEKFHQLMGKNKLEELLDLYHPHTREKMRLDLDVSQNQFFLKNEIKNKVICKDSGLVIAEITVQLTKEIRSHYIPNLLLPKGFI